MAFGSIEITTITRAQDYTTIKHNEDHKAGFEQANLSQQAQKTETEKANSVTDSQNAEWNNKRQDARDKGSNEYAGDGGKRRKDRESEDKVVVKGRGSFDMKV